MFGTFFLGTPVTEWNEMKDSCVDAKRLGVFLVYSATTINAINL